MNTSHIKYRSASTNFPIKPVIRERDSFHSGKAMRSTGSFFNSTQSFTTIKNTQGKLKSLEDELNDLIEEIHKTRDSTKAASFHVSSMRTDLLERELQSINCQLNQQVHGLSKLIEITVKTDEMRCRQLWKDTQSLLSNNKTMKNSLEEIKQKIDKIEHVFGVYSAAEKHLY